MLISNVEPDCMTSLTCAEIIQLCSDYVIFVIICEVATGGVGNKTKQRKSKTKNKTKQIKAKSKEFKIPGNMSVSYRLSRVLFFFFKIRSQFQKVL